MALFWHLGRLFSWPHWVTHALRTVLTSIGVALGVATVVGIADVSRSVLAAFQSMVDAVAGEAELEVSNPAGDVDEAVVDALANVDGVSTAVGVIEQFVPLRWGTEASIYLLGLDFLGSNLWREQFPRKAVEIDDELEFLARSDSVAVPRSLMVREGLAIGDALVVVTADGPRTLRIRGAIGDAPAAKLFGGAVALMDLPAAQAVLGRHRRVDRIAVDARPDVDRDQLMERLRSALTGMSESSAHALEVAPPEARGKQAERLLFSLRTTLAIMSLGAVIVGAFIVYHTIAISVLQRRREFALLNASGVAQRTLVRICVLETLLLAIPGTICGLGMGKLIAHVASGVVGDTAAQIWTPLYVASTKGSIVGATMGCLIGVITSIGAAYVAIRATLKAPTVETLRPVGLASVQSGAIGLPLLLGSGLIAGSWFVLLVPPGIGYLSTVAAIVGSHVLAYLGVAVVAGPCVWLVGMLAIRGLTISVSLPVALAAQNLPRQPGRSAGTVATISATMGIAVVVTSLIASFESGWLSWVDRHFGADLFVGRGRSVKLIAGDPIPLTLAARIEGIPGIAAVEPFRTIRTRIGEAPVFLQGLSPEVRLARGGLPMVEGSLKDAAPAIQEGSGVLLSDNLSYKLGLHKGDTLNLATPTGVRRFRIEGVYVDYLGSLDLGSVVVGQGQLEGIWGDRSANLLRLWLEPGTSHDDVRDAVNEVLAGRYGADLGAFYVLDPASFLRGVRSAVQKFFAATWALQVVAALVGVIGVVNTQLATVLDRKAEIGVLRTIGVSRKDIIRSVVLECGALGALGGILGVALGLVLGAQIVLVSLKLVTGWSMAFHVPWAQLAAGIVIATGVSAVAGYVPARAAARVQLGQRSFD